MCTTPQAVELDELMILLLDATDAHLLATRSALTSLFERFDLDHNGRIDFKEFVNIIVSIDKGVSEGKRRRFQSIVPERSGLAPELGAEVSGDLSSREMDTRLDEAEVLQALLINDTNLDGVPDAKMGDDDVGPMGNRTLQELMEMYAFASECEVQCVAGDGHDGGIRPSSFVTMAFEYKVGVGLHYSKRAEVTASYASGLEI
eukprot:SAG11_NODE_911_length_6582_cov_9.565633_3_plen_203_part_00